MAHHQFDEQIFAMTGFDATSSSTVGFGDATGRELSAEWLQSGAKELINTLPPQCLYSVAADATDLTDGNGSTINNCRVLGVTRKDKHSGLHLPCREIHQADLGKATPDSGYMEEAFSEDPVFYKKSNKIFVLPTPSATYPAKINTITFPTISYNATSISTFPDELETLVIQYAIIKATEHELANNQDTELSNELLRTFKGDYFNSLESYLKLYGMSNAQIAPQQGGDA
jgi:hypothetical protein